MMPLVVLLAAIAAFQSGGTDRPIALTHVTLIDGRGGPALPDATIIIENGRIVAVGRSSSIVQPPHARTIDLAGRVVTPGFIGAADLHAAKLATHFPACTHTELRRSVPQALAETPEPAAPSMASS